MADTERGQHGQRDRHGGESQSPASHHAATCSGCVGGWFGVFDLGRGGDFGGEPALAVSPGQLLQSPVRRPQLRAHVVLGPAQHPGDVGDRQAGVGRDDQDLTFVARQGGQFGHDVLVGAGLEALDVHEFDGRSVCARWAVGRDRRVEHGPEGEAVRIVEPRPGRVQPGEDVVDQTRGHGAIEVDQRRDADQPRSIGADEGSERFLPYGHRHRPILSLVTLFGAGGAFG